MLNFITMIIAINLLFFMLIYSFRQFIPLKISVVMSTGIVSMLSAILFPYLTANLPYPLVIVVFLFFLLICAITLALVNEKINTAKNTEDFNEVVTERDLETASVHAEIVSTTTGTLPDEIPDEIIEEIVIRKQVTTGITNNAENTENTETNETTETTVLMNEPVQLMFDHTAFDQTSKDQIFSKLDGSLPEQTDAQPEAAPSSVELNALKTTVSINSCELTDSTTGTETNADTDININAGIMPPEELKPDQYAQDINKSNYKQPEIVVSQTYEPVVMNAKELLPQEDQAEHTQPEKLQQLITDGFTARKAGYYEQAIKNFYTALQLDPAPKLAVLIMLEISEIYTLIDQTWQAAEILKALLVKWQHELDTVTINELKNKINILQNAA